MNKYFGWPAYWGGGAYGELPAVAVPPGRDYLAHGKENPHLRSAEQVAGYTVWDDDGEVGRPEHFIVDEASWHISYLDVKTGDWLHSRSTLLPQAGSVPSHRPTVASFYTILSSKLRVLV